MQALRVDDAAIGAAPFLLVCCARNERERFPAFLAHYRRLGVGHFLIVDNGSTDGSAEALAREPDCSLWSAPGSYRAARFGMDWCNALLAQYGVDKWCLVVDPDEFLVFPHSEQRTLRGLTRYMESIGQPSLFTVLVDCYGEGRPSQTVLTGDADPFVLCPWFDRFNLTQKYKPEDERVWVQGGVRMRRFFAHQPERAPALNKVPLVHWRADFEYVSSTHHLLPSSLNCTVRWRPEAVSGALMHFKFVDHLQGKVAEELERREHYGDGIEYRTYFDAQDPVLHDPDVSVRYEGTAQLARLGFLQRGAWF